MPTAAAIAAGRSEVGVVVPFRTASGRDRVLSVRREPRLSHLEWGKAERGSSLG